MANTKAYVSSGKPNVNGAVYRAALGSTLPTSVDDTLDAAFVAMGYISNAGVTNSKTRDTTEITAWGGDVVANPQNKKTDNFKMKFIEVLNTEVLKTAFGDDNVSGTLAAGLTLRENASELDHAAWVIDRVLDDGTKSRTVIADGQPISIDDVNYVDNDVIGFDTTIAAYPYSTWSGDTHREYLKSA